MADYIERRRALDILHAIGGCGAEPGTWADGYDKAINEAYDRISREPAADVTPVVHGRWIAVKYNAHCSCGKSYGTYHSSCSACNHVAYSQPYGLNFCPNCGAKMDGKDTNIPTTKEDEA